MIRAGRVEIGNWFPQSVCLLPLEKCRKITPLLERTDTLLRVSLSHLSVSVCESGMRVPLKNMSDDCDLAGWQWPRSGSRRVGLSVGNLAAACCLSVN